MGQAVTSPLLSRRWIALALGAAAGLVPATVWAAEPGPRPEEPVSLAATAWALFSAAAVLLMVVPGLALFYGGLVRRKNVLATLLPCFVLAAAMAILWGLVGYSLAFGGRGGWIGNFDFALLRNLVGPDAPAVGAIPRAAHFLLQGMYFTLAPALICGAFAERMRFAATILFCLLWGLCVYCPVAHAVWNGGLLAFDSPWSQWIGGGGIDFAGGLVVHATAGAAGLICSLLVGRRLGYGSDDMRPHNLTYTLLGAALLWIGWFGFNAGAKAESADLPGLAATAMLNTHLAAAGGVAAWMLLESWLAGRATSLGAGSGAVCGLVAVTPSAGWIAPAAALAVGLIAGGCCYAACTRLKRHLGYDDTLDVFGIHGGGAVVGGILAAVFASPAVHPDAPTGLLSNPASGALLLLGQMATLAATFLYSGFATWLLLRVLDATVGLRVSQRAEMDGLDVSEHGEEGYIAGL